MGGTVALGLLLPFAGTTLGAAMVFFLKREIAPKLQKLLLGFASGVMIAGVRLVGSFSLRWNSRGRAG